MSILHSSFMDVNFKETQGGKDIKPPLIPSNTDKVFATQGVYNLRGFYQDLNTRIL